MAKGALSLCIECKKVGWDDLRLDFLSSHEKRTWRQKEAKEHERMSVTVQLNNQRTLTIVPCLYVSFYIFSFTFSFLYQSALKRKRMEQNGAHGSSRSIGDRAMYFPIVLCTHKPAAKRHADHDGPVPSFRVHRRRIFSRFFFELLDFFRRQMFIFVCQNGEKETKWDCAGINCTPCVPGNRDISD